MIKFHGFFASIALVCAAMIPAAARATPPDVIDVGETPFGISSTHVFVLRVSRDNLGTYESLRVESFLVAIDLESGEEEAWLLDRVVHFRDYGADGEPVGEVARRDEGLEAVNPYIILTERNAVPVIGAGSNCGDCIPPQIDSEQASVTVTYAHGTQYSASADQVASALERRRRFMATNVAEHSRMSGISTRQLFAERKLAPTDCSAKNLVEYWILGKGPIKMVQLICDAGEDEGADVIVLPLTKVK